MAELHELGVAEAAAKIQRHEVSAVELVQALLARIAATEPRVQAWAAVDAERALAAAAECDAAVADGRGRFLNGVPVGLKAIYNVASLPTTAGWDVAPPPTATRDAYAVALLRRRGAVVLGHTVSTPFAMNDPPRTRNPWDPTRTPGGSSSGSAAAVAARQVPAALGTQTAGSVLRPAAYCGVVGLKATYGRVSRQGIVPLSWSLDHPGPITRSVEDAALLLEALADRDATTQTGQRPAGEFTAAVAAPAPPRLGLVREVLDRAEPEVRDHTAAVVARLERAGAQVHEVPLPEPFELWLAAHQVIMLAEAAAAHADLHARRAAEYPPKLRANVEVGQLIPAAAFVRAQQWRRRLRRGALAMFAGVDCLVMPTASNVAPDSSTTGDTRFQALWSLVGLPALSLPSGLSAERLPFALQLVAPPWQEATLLRAARWCEQELGPLPPPF
ncbi:MAG TPA: amidase [Chloroflexota bacterium]|nr:amidase [Chloroflexota bacterium]